MNWFPTVVLGSACIAVSWLLDGKLIDALLLYLLLLILDKE